MEEHVCCFCGIDFTPWYDEEEQEINDEACRSCDQSYIEGLFNDRDLE